MPCICHGAITAGEFLNDHKKTVDQVNDILENAARLINIIDIHRPEECFQQEHYQKWELAFAHHLRGCPEERQK